MPFRCGFVISGLIIIAAHTAWPPRRAHPRTTSAPLGFRRAFTASRDWPGPLAWGCAGVLFALLARTVTGPGEDFLFVDPRAAQPGWAGLGIGLATSLALTLAATRRGALWRRAASAVLILATIAGIGLTIRENVANSLFVNVKLRIWASELFPKASQDAARLRAADVATRKAGWPMHRVNTDLVSEDPIWSRYNASGRYSFPGISYYSTTIEAATARALVGLGYSNRNGGRTLYRPHDEVLSALLAAEDPRSRFDPLPMVRTAPGITIQPDLPKDMAARETLLGARIYSSPALYRITGTGAEPIGAELIGAPLVVPAGTSQDVRISCPAGNYVITHQYFHGMTRLIHPDGSSVQVAESEEVAKERVVGPHFLVSRSDGTATTIRFMANGAVKPDQRTILPDGLGCLDPGPLQQRIAATASPSELDITPSAVRAEFTTPQTGRLVVATTAVNGWSCRVDGRRTELEPLAGMLAVDVTAVRQLDCGYRAPGLGAGIAAGVASLLITALITIAQRRRAPRGEEP